MNKWIWWSEFKKIWESRLCCFD